MILLSGKVGYRRLYEPDRVIPGQALFFAMFFSSLLRSLVFCRCRLSQIVLRVFADSLS